MKKKKEIDLSRPEGMRQGAYKAAGVVLLRREGSVKSLDLLLFLRSFGAVWVSAPGALSRNRFGGGIEPMVWGEYDLYQSPKRLYLKSVDAKEDFIGVRASRKKLTAALKWCGELARRLPPGMENDQLLSLFWGSMKNLRNGADAALLDLRFAWRWANIWGLAPTLDACSVCGKQLSPLVEEGVSFVLLQDGIACAKCAGQAGTAKISVDHDAMACAALAATLPADGFVSWERSASAVDFDLSPVAGWLYSFISV